MNFLLAVSKTTGQVEQFLSCSYQMPPLSDLGVISADLDVHELLDKATHDFVLTEIIGLGISIESISHQLLDPEISEKDAARLRESRDRLQADLDTKRAALRPFVDGEVTRDRRLVTVDGGFRTEPSPNQVQPEPSLQARDLANEIDILQAITKDHEARLEKNISGHIR